MVEQLHKQKTSGFRVILQMDDRGKTIPFRNSKPTFDGFGSQVKRITNLNYSVQQLNNNKSRLKLYRNTKHSPTLYRSLTNIASGAYIFGLLSIGLNMTDFLLVDMYMSMTIPAVVLLQVMNRFWHRAYRHQVTEIDMVINWK